MGSSRRQGSHLSELGLLSRALYLRGPPSAVNTTSTSVKMVITFSKGEKERKEGFQAGWHHTKICLELCWLLLPLPVHLRGSKEWGRMDSDSSVGIQGAPGAEGSILNGNTMGSDTSQGTQINLKEPPKTSSLILA